MANKTGFSLIELSLVLVIISILALLSYPSYTRHIMRARRLFACSELSRLSVDMEKYYIQHRSYENATLITLHFPARIAQGAYEVEIREATADDFLLAAIPQEQQESDECGMLTLDELGQWGNGKCC